MMRLFICFICALLFHIFLLKFEIPQCSKPQKATQIRHLEIHLQEIKYIHEVTQKEEPNRAMEFKEARPEDANNKIPQRKTKETFRRKEEGAVEETGAKPTKEKDSLVQQDQPHKEGDLAFGTDLGEGGNIKEAREMLAAVNPRPLEQYIPPQYDHNPPPKYPKAALKAGYQGRVLLEVLITTEGKPREIKLKESSGYRILDEAAVKAVQEWNFVPAKRGGMFLEEWVLVPIRFNLEESSKE